MKNNLRLSHLRLFIAAALLAPLLFASCKKNKGGSNPAPPVDLLNKAAWNVVFQDDFNGTSLDVSKWSYGFGWGPESASFNEYTTPNNTYTQGGNLVIKGENLSTGGKPFTSGALNTKSKFTQRYGYLEVRMKAAEGKGLNSAFWAKSADESWPPEIDVVEVLGRDPQTLHTTIHFKNSSGAAASNGNAAAQTAKLSDDFHTYGTIWTDTEVIWLLDDKVVRRISGSDVTRLNANNQPFYLHLNMHIGGNTWMGEPDATTPWPAYMLVDWVKVYKLK